MVASLKVRRQKSTSFGSLQQHNAAAVARRHAAPTRQRVPRAHGRTRSPRQLRVSQFEYASSLALTELVIDRHHHEVALRQVSSGRPARRSPTACLWSTPARRGGGRSLWELPNTLMGVVRPTWVFSICGTGGGSAPPRTQNGGRATLEWSRDCGRADLEGRERLRSVLYVGIGSLRGQPDCWGPAVLLLVLSRSPPLTPGGSFSDTR